MKDGMKRWEEPSSRDLGFRTVTSGQLSTVLGETPKARMKIAVCETIRNLLCQDLCGTDSEGSHRIILILL